MDEPFVRAGSHDSDLELLELHDEQEQEQELSSPDGQKTPLSKPQAWNLYTSHALSTWNARTYEFAAILFTASAFPNTLLASSIRGLCSTLTALCFSSSIGSWIDKSPSRLRPLLSTISTNRAAVILACFIWILLVKGHDSEQGSTSDAAKSPARIWLFALAVLLGTVEKLSGLGNMISMERDWIPVLAAPLSVEMASAYDLTQLNAVMRRIDLVCKLIAPVVIALIILLAGSTRVGVMAVAGMSCSSWGIEVWSANRVWLACPQLQQTKTTRRDRGRSGPLSCSWKTGAIRDIWNGQIKQLKEYFSTDVWIPSLSLALLHLSVLTYNATFITYLLSSGFSLLLITTTRAISSIVEVSSTFVTPIGTRYLARSSNIALSAEDEEGLLGEQGKSEKEHAVGLERLGLWGVLWQLINLIPVSFAIWHLGNLWEAGDLPSTVITRITALISSTSKPLLATISMFFFLSASRLGLWVFDLVVQEISQSRVPPNTRASFAGTEMSFVSLFELSQWILAAIFSRPEDFRWLASGSLGAVSCASALYALWVRRQRGHLTHWSRIRSGCDCAKGRL